METEKTKLPPKLTPKDNETEITMKLYHSETDVTYNGENKKITTHKTIGGK